MNALRGWRSATAILAILVPLTAACAGGDRGSSDGGATQGNPGSGGQTVGVEVRTVGLEALREAVDGSPDDYASRRRLAIALFDANRADDAVAEFEAALRLRDDERSLLDLALAYGAASRMDEAEATYRRMLERSPRHAIALHNLGNLAFKRGDMNQAAEWYRRALAVEPGYLSAQYHLGESLERAERYRDAYAAYNRVLTLEPDSADELGLYDDALYQMASLDLMMGAHARAAEILETLLAERPDHYGAHYAYAQALLKLGRTDEARRQLELHRDVLAARNPTGPVATMD